MSYREVSVIEVKEILRLWLDGHSLRKVTTLAGVDRKTVRRYVEAAQAAGLNRDGGGDQLGDELLGQVIAAVRPERPRGIGVAREALEPYRGQIKEWLEKDLTLVKVHVLLGRRGVVVPYRTLHRFAVEELGFGRRRPTVPVVDGDPGVELQVDFGRLGLIPDPARGARRVVHGLIFTAVYSRHTFVFGDPPPNSGGGDRRVRGRLALLRRGIQGRHPGQPQAGHRSSRSHRAPVQRRVPRVCPG
jgi:hypothetical protein